MLGFTILSLILSSPGKGEVIVYYRVKPPRNSRTASRPAASARTTATMVLKLHGVPLSQPFRSVAWACLQKRLPFEVNLVVPGMASKMGSKGAAYLKLNPTGTVPTLEDDGVVVLESAAMLTYLANKHKWTDLYPQEAAARARMPHSARTPN